MAVPYTFANATTSIPLSQLDSNFATGITLGNTTVYLGNTTTSFGNVTLTGATISSANVTITGGSINGTPIGNSSSSTGAFSSVTTTGNVTVGVSSFNYTVAGVGLRNGGYSYFTQTSAAPILVNRKGTTGAVMSINYEDSGVGSISTDGANTAYNTSSDYRLKDNVAPLSGSGEFIDALQPKTWVWKKNGKPGVGFIAHEVQKVSPGSVVGEKDAVDESGNPDYQAMEYGSAEFIANIVAELKSIRVRVAALEKK